MKKIRAIIFVMLLIGSVFIPIIPLVSGDVDSGYVYAGGDTTKTARKYLKSDMSYIDETASYGNTIRTIDIDDTYIYVGGFDTVKKYLKSDMSYIGQTVSYGGYIYAVDIDDTHIYAGGHATDTVRRYLKSDLSYIDETSSYGDTIRAIAVDGTHIYVGGEDTNTVRKYLKSDLSYIGETATYDGYIYAVNIDDTHIYAGGQYTRTVRKYLKSDLSYIGETANYGDTIWAVDIDDTHIYVGGESTKRVRKYLKSDLSYIGQTADYGGYIYAVAVNGIHIYAGGGTPTNRVRKYLKSDMSYISQADSYGGTIFAVAVEPSPVFGTWDDIEVNYPENQSVSIAPNPTLNITADDTSGLSYTLTWYSNSSDSWVPFGTNSSTTTRYEYYTGPITGAWTGIWGGYKASQTFTVGTVSENTLHEIDKVSLFLGRNGALTTYSTTVEIREVNETGAPVGAVLATSTTIPAADIPEEWGYITFTFSVEPTVEPSTQYAIVISAPDAPDADNCIAWASWDDSPYGGGCRWTQAPEQPWNDHPLYVLRFQEYGTTKTYYQTNSNFSGYGTNYYWYVNKTNASGTYQSETFCFHTYPNYSIDVTADTYNRTSINISWIGGTNATSFHLERHTSPFAAYGTGTIIYEGSNTWYDDIGLLPGTTYYYIPWGIATSHWGVNSTSSCNKTEIYPTITDDSHVYQGSPGTNYGSWDTMELFDMQNFEERMLLKSDLSDIPEGSVIESAEVFFYYKAEAGEPAPSKQLNLYSNTQTWDESTVTWNNKPIATSLVSTTTVGTEGSWRSFNIKEDVQDILNGVHENYGWTVKFNALVSSGETEPLYDSSESTQNHPYLRVVYEYGPSAFNTTIDNIPPEFANESVSPLLGIESVTVFNFNVSVRDIDDSILDVFCVITRGAWEDNSTMTWVTGDNLTGANFTYSRILPNLGEYSYKFKALDGFGWNTSTTNYFQVSTNVSFEVNFPTYLEVGDYILSFGTLKTTLGDPLNYTWVHTKIINDTDCIVLGSDMPFYVVNGLYWYSFSTSTMIPGVYDIIVNFTYLGLEFSTNRTLYLSDYSGPGHYATDAYFAFYNNNTGVGIEPLSFKIYVSNTIPLSDSDRIYGNTYHNTYTGETLYYRVNDYFDNQIYPSVSEYDSVLITETKQFIDVPIDWYSFSVKNMNSSIIKFTIKNGTRSYTQYLYPYEPFYWNLLEGEYNITMDYYDPISGYFETKYDNITINSATFYWIQGYDLRDIVISIIAVNSTIDTLVFSLSLDVSIINSNITNLTSFMNTFWDAQNSSFENVNSIMISMWDTQNSSFLSINQTILAFWDAQNSTFDSVFNSIFSVWNSQNVSFGSIDSVLLQIWNSENTTFESLNNTIHQFWNNQNTSFGDLDNLILQFWNSENTSFGDISNSLNSIWNTENSTFENLSITLASFWVSQNDSFDNVENTLISIWNTENSTFENVTSTLSDIWYAQNTSFGSIDTVMFQIWSTENTTFEYVTNTLTQMWLNQNSSFNTVENYVIQLWGNQNSTFENVTNQITQFWANQNTSFDTVRNDISAFWVNFNSTFGTVNQTIISLWNSQNSSFDEITNTVFNIWDSQNCSFENVTDITLSFWNAQNSSFENLTIFINTQLNYINNSINVIFIGVNSKLNIMHNDMNISFIYINSRVNFSYNSIIQNITEMNLTLFNKMMQILDDVSYAGESVFNKTVSILDNLVTVEINISGDIIDKTLEIISHVTNESTVNMMQILEILDRIGNITNATVAGLINQILNNLINITANYTVNMTMVIDAIDQAVSQIQDTKSVLYRTLVNLREWLNQQVMPDVRIVSRNPIMTYSIYDTEGAAIGDSYKICPPLITIATTRVTQYGNWINSTPMIPGNGSVLNGTITIIRDTLYMSGSASWVNITYMDNGTTFCNTSFVSSRIDIYGENLTINASGDISVLRVTKYNQVRKFDWTVYPFSGHGYDPDRAWWHEAGIEVVNCLPVPLYEVFVIAGFPPETSVDGSSVEIRDTTNGGVILEKGPDYDVTDTSVHFATLCLAANETRAFTIGFYKQELDSYIYDEGTVSIPTYDIVMWDSKSYNSFSIHWNNPHSTTFKGALYVRLDFDIPTAIDTSSMRIYDVTFDREIDPSLFIPGSSYIRISAEAMQDVLPGSSREFEVYFLMTVYPGYSPEEFHLDTPIWQGISMFILIFFAGLVFIIIGAFLAVSERKERKDRWKVCIAFGIFIVVVINVMAAMGL